MFNVELDFNVQRWWFTLRYWGIDPATLINLTIYLTLAKILNKKIERYIRAARASWVLCIILLKLEWLTVICTFILLTPGIGCEVFCGKIPRDVYEDELVILFEKCGRIYDLRLMMEPLSGTNRGYAFVTYTSRDEADNATREVSVFYIHRKDQPSTIYIVTDYHRNFIS